MSDAISVDLSGTHVLILTLDVDEVRRTSVSPPELTRDTPILDTLEPAIPLGFGRLGRDLKFSGACPLEVNVDINPPSIRERATYLERLLRQRLTVHPPLRLEDGLYDVPRLATNRNLHRVVLRLDVQPRVLERLHHSDARVEAPHTSELGAGVLVKGPVVVEDVDNRQVVTEPHVVVVRIVPGRDFHGARTEGHVDGDVVSDNGDAAFEEGVFGEFAVEVLWEGYE